MLDPNIFWKIGNKYTRHTSYSQNVGRRRLKSMFGVTPKVCSLIWNLILPILSIECSPCHLLWALMFLRCYNTEETNRAIVKTDEKTFRKYSCILINYISRMRVVSKMIQLFELFIFIVFYNI